MLTGELGKPGRLCRIAVVARHNHQFQVEATQTHKAQHIIETDRDATRFPACNGGLGRAGSGGQLGLSEPGAPARLTDQIAAVRTHLINITDPSYAPQIVGPAEFARRMSPVVCVALGRTLYGCELMANLNGARRSTTFAVNRPRFLAHFLCWEVDSAGNLYVTDQNNGVLELPVQ